MSAVLQDRPEPGTVDLTRSLPGQEALLTPAAQTFLAGLHVRFEGERQARLAARRARQACFDAGALPDFRDDTASIRASDWRVAPIPTALQDRRVEITGPVDPKMVINALNSGANCCDRSSEPRSRWSMTRPGVPTTTCTPRFSALSCGM